MPNLTTMHLKCLIEKATPGPWEAEEDVWGHVDVSDGTGHKMIWGGYCVFRSKSDPKLAALAPELAQEVIHLRDALGYLVEETRLAAENSDDAVVQKRVADAIKTAIAKIQGDHDE